MLQSIAGQQHAPSRQVFHWGRTDCLFETQGEYRSGHSGTFCLPLMESLGAATSSQST